MSNKKNINKLKDVFQKQIPSREYKANVEGLRTGFFRGTINGVVLSAYLLTIFYFIIVNQDNSVFHLIPIFLIPPVFVLTSKFIQPKEFEGKFEGKLIILYLIIAAFAVTLAYLLIY